MTKQIGDDDDFGEGWLHRGDEAEVQGVNIKELDLGPKDHGAGRGSRHGISRNPNFITGADTSSHTGSHKSRSSGITWYCIVDKEFRLPVLRQLPDEPPRGALPPEISRERTLHRHHQIKMLLLANCPVYRQRF